MTRREPAAKKSSNSILSRMCPPAMRPDIGASFPCIRYSGTWWMTSPMLETIRGSMRPRWWRAFTGLRSDRFVYLPAFLDRLVELAPSESLGIEQIVRGRSIDYRAGARPSIAGPFPRRVSGADAVTGGAGFAFQTACEPGPVRPSICIRRRGRAVSLRLDITGVGPGGNPGANDLDLFLMDWEGRVLARSDQGLNGQPERIATFLPAGRYVVEVRSFYTHGETETLIFNSGSYRLQFQLP